MVLCVDKSANFHVFSLHIREFGGDGLDLDCFHSQSFPLKPPIIVLTAQSPRNRGVWRVSVWAETPSEAGFREDWAEVSGGSIRRSHFWGD